MKRLIAVAFVAGGLSAGARTLVWYHMDNDAGDDGIVAATTFRNAANETGEFEGRLGPNCWTGYKAKPSAYNYENWLPVPTNGFESGFMLRDGLLGLSTVNDYAVHFPSPIDVTDGMADNQLGSAIYVHDPEQKLNLQTFTVEFFFRTLKYTNWHGYFAKGLKRNSVGSSSRTVTMEVYEASYSKTRTSLSLIYAYVGKDGEPVSASGQSIYSSSSPVLQDGAWHHVAFTVDQASRLFKFYVDGTLQSTTTLLGDLAYGTDPDYGVWNFLGDMAGDHAWGGTIDEIRISDRALQPDEMLCRVSQDAPVPAVNRWTNASGGSWAEPTNWELGVPSSTTELSLVKTAANAVTVDSPVSLPKNLYAYGEGASPLLFDVQSELAIPGGDLELRDNAALRVATDGSVRLASGGRLALSSGCALDVRGKLEADHSSVVAEGSAVTVKGGTVSLAESPLTVGGTLSLSNAVFALTNDSDSAFTLTTDTRLDVIDTAMELIYDHATANGGSLIDWSGARVHVSGDSSIRGGKCNEKYWTPTFKCEEMVFSGNASLTLPSTYFGSSGAGRPSVYTFRDHASFSLLNSPILYIGGAVNSPSAWTTFNWESDVPLQVAYGVQVGVTQSAELNIRGGGRVESKGNMTAIGMPDTGNGVVTGVVRVIDGAYVNNRHPQYAGRHLYGLDVGDSTWRARTETGVFGRGFLYVYPDGVVSNLPAGSTTPGAGSYLRVGSGVGGEGDVVQFGGEIFHDGRLECLIGFMGGTGRWTMSGGRSLMKTDVYVGGAVSNVLTGVIHGTNGGTDFDKYFDQTCHSAKGTLTVSNGTFVCDGKALVVSMDGMGTLVLGGDSAALVQAKDVTLNGGTTARFAFGERGVGKLVADEKMTIAAGTQLVLDLTNFALQKSRWYPLVLAKDLEGEFTTVEYVGEQPAYGELRKTVRNGVRGYWYHVGPSALLMVR